MRLEQRRALVLIALAALGMVLAMPALLWGAGHGRGGYPIEYGFALLLLLLSARSRFTATAMRLVLTLLYVVTLLFLAYDDLFPAFFHHEAALVEDRQLAINLFHFLREMKTWRWVVGELAAAVGLLALTVAIERLFAAAQKNIRPSSMQLGLALAGWMVVTAVTTAVRTPFAVVARQVAGNYRASVAAQERLATLQDGSRDDRYRDAMKVRLARKPNFDFLVIEAYGEVLSTWDMTVPYHALMDRVTERLGRAGFHMRSSYSVSPIHGGRSWLSIATMQTGVTIDVPTSFTAFEPVSKEVPTLGGWFKAQGYTDASLEPGTSMKTGVKEDLYPDDVRYDDAELHYGGPKWGFSGVPDKFAWDDFRARGLPTLKDPRYLFYMAVSTHYPWTAETIPTYQTPDWPELPGLDAIGSDFRRWYMKSVDYEFHVLCEALENDPSPDLVVVIIGDHQPRLESSFPGEVTFDTPIHVLSRDESFVDRFALFGFQPGMFAEPGRSEPMAHAGLFSLMVSQLASAYGTPETKGLAHYEPHGIGLAGLKP